MSYNIDQEPIVLSKPLIDLILKQKNPADLIALYTFYYYTANWQKTNKIGATVSYVAKGLKWGMDKTRDRRKQLKAIGLIEDKTQAKKGERGFGKSYVGVKFIWTQEKANNVLGDLCAPRNTHHVKSDTNALRDSNRNALRDSKQMQGKNLGLTNQGNKLNLPKHLAIELFPKKFQRDERFQEHWVEWVKYRKTEKKNSIGIMSFKKLLNKIKKWGVEDSIYSINNSIENGYTGLFEPNKNKQTKKELSNAFHGENIPDYDEGAEVFEV